MSSVAAAVPMTVIGGYLGAGKTTLVNRLLAGDHGRRLAVLVNDFGSVNIDADLIASHAGDTIRLQNGCICCSIGDALGEALDQLLALEPRPDHIVVEASGVAEPAGVAAHGSGRRDLRLDGSVVLADVETVQQRAGDRFVGDLIRRQLAQADLVLLTKCDLVEADAVAAAERWLASATTAPVVTTGLENEPDAEADVVLGPLASSAGHDAAAGPPTVDGGLLFEAASVQLVGPVERDRLEAVLAGWPDDVVRVKGVVDVGDEGTHVVHRVGRRWSIEAAPTRLAERDEPGSLVVIGRFGAVDAAALLAELAEQAGQADRP